MRPSTALVSALMSSVLAACAPAVSAPARTTPPVPAPAAPIAANPVSATPVAATPVAAAPVTPPVAAAPVPAAPSGFRAVPELSSSPVRSFPAAPPMVIDPARQYRAVLKTSRGDVTVELLPQAAPVAVNNFVFLALNHFYDGTRFHRVIDGFMAQGGDPLSADDAQKARWGTGGPGYQFSAEVMNGLRFDRAGVLGMARAQSLSSQGSQFFITVAPADFLSGSYTVFGRVVAGQDVLNRLQRNDSGGGPIPGAGADTLLGVQILQAP